jgi:hypothetical protein
MAEISYKPQFQHKDWIDFVDPVQAGGGNGFNERFHKLENEFELIAASIASIESASPAIGIAISNGIFDGIDIPVPTGFLPSETQFFAFVESYIESVPPPGGKIGFLTSINNQIAGRVRVFDTSFGPLPPGKTVTVTGVAIAKKGGWQ